MILGTPFFMKTEFEFQAEDWTLLDNAERLSLMKLTCRKCKTQLASEPSIKLTPGAFYIFCTTSRTCEYWMVVAVQCKCQWSKGRMHLRQCCRHYISKLWSGTRGKPDQKLSMPVGTLHHSSHSIVVATSGLSNHHYFTISYLITRLHSKVDFLVWWF